MLDSYWIEGIVIIVASTIAIYFFFRKNEQPSHNATSTAEILDVNENADASITRNNASKSKLGKIKNFYSRIVKKKSASLTEFPQLQRRHSTVGNDFPESGRMARAAKAAKSLIPELVRRQMSVGGAQNREALPKPPSEFFEPLEHPVVPDRYKPITYIKQNTKIFEFPSSCTIEEGDIESMVFETNEFIAKPGDPDDSIYVVLEGCLSVYITPQDGKTIMVRRIAPGECFFSPLSLFDIFMERQSFLKTVSLKAAIKTRLAKYSIANLYRAYKNDPDQSAWVRTVQIITTRLLHVVLTTLHQHLGLGEELMNKRLTSINRPKGIRRGDSLRGANKMKPKLKRMPTELGNTNDEQKMSLALEYFRDALKLTEDEAEKFLRPIIRILHLEEHHTLFEEGNAEASALGMVISGVLKLSQESSFSDNFEYEDSDKDSWCAYIQPRELIGGLQILTDEAFYTVKAACPSIVAFIDKKDINQLIEQKPSIVFPIAYSVLQRVSSFVRAIDFALGWVMLDSGEALYRKGDYSDSVFVVLSGRLRSVTNKMMVEEFGKGDVLGIIEVLQQSQRTTTVLAVRYSQLAKVPEGMLNFVKMQFPQVGFRLVRLLGQYYSGRVSTSSFITPHTVPDPMTQRNLHTIAIFPASLDVPLIAYTCELYHALSATTRVLRLSSKSVVGRLGEEAVMGRNADFRLMHWLNSQEDTYHLVLYECDYTATNWTRRCLSQADAILIVACGNQKPPEKHFIDEHLKKNQEGIRSRKELVLLWPNSDANPTGTYEWLQGSWFSGHYHIHAPDRMFSWEAKVDKNEKEILDFYEHHVFPFGIDVHGDFARLARILSGNAVGLVLGGGGARGGAHIGVIRALREQGIPVDIVGGTSIGSMIGGVFAMNPYDMDYLTDQTGSWFTGMCSYWKTIMDLTWAYAARFSGKNFNKLLQEVFKERNIEDLWLSYFCITTDITNSEMRVHRNGPLWRYVRASMTLAVYLPPICDSEDGHYLLDGGYVNNLPADVMRTMGARTVIAIDVSSADEKDFHNYGDCLNGFYASFRSMLPWQKEAAKILTSQEIQDRLAFVSSVRQLELVKKAPYCTYIRPPIDNFQTLDFAKFTIIQGVGYNYAAEILPELINNNSHLKTLVNHERLLSMMRSSSAIRAGSRSLHNSFTDLAAQISRIPVKHCRSLDDLSKVMDEEEDEELEDEHERTDSDTGMQEKFAMGKCQINNDDEIITIELKGTITLEKND